MPIFTYKMPIYKGNTNKIQVFNGQKEVVGYIERSYSGFIQRSLDFILNNEYIINVNSYSATNDLFTEITEEFGRGILVRSKWKCSSVNLGNFTVLDKTKIKTNPTFELTSSNGDKFIIKKDFADKRVAILKENGGEVALITYDKIIPPRTIKIKILSQDLHFLEVAALHLLFDIKD